MKRPLLFLLLTLLCIQLSAQQSRYVLAPSGLNLRESANPGSTKLARVPYGAKVQLIEEAHSGDLLVDNIPGGMAQVSYQGQNGYIFDGYLCRFSAPQYQEVADKSLQDYAETLRGEGHNVLFETINRDWGGYYQSEYALEIPTPNIYEAYVLAREAFRIPKQLHLPKAQKGEAVTENPDKEEHVWMETLTVQSQAGSERPASITYYIRMEGGGSYVTIEASSQQEETMRISITYIAD